MSLSVSQIIAARGPQFTGDPRLSSLVTLAKKELDATAFGDNYNKAVAYKVLHILTLEKISQGNPGTGANSGVQVGGVDSVSEGDVSVSYSKPGSSSSSSLSARNDDLSSTQFGKELLALMKRSIVTFRNNTI